jgi:hypothetical protein
VVQAALAQFPDVKVEVKICPRIKTGQQISQVIQQAGQEGGMIVYTLVCAALRESLFKEARAANVLAIDLLGPILVRLEEFFKLPPKGMPGIFKPSPGGYDPRIEAINFTVDHDDGQKKRFPGSSGYRDFGSIPNFQDSTECLSVFTWLEGG